MEEQHIDFGVLMSFFEYSDGQGREDRASGKEQIVLGGKLFELIGEVNGELVGVEDVDPTFGEEDEGLASELTCGVIGVTGCVDDIDF
jgi:hypothetical protein